MTDREILRSLAGKIAEIAATSKAGLHEIAVILG